MMVLRTSPGALDVAPWGEYVKYLGLMTVETFDTLPLWEGWTYELHEGRLIAMPAPARRHADIQVQIVDLLSPFIKSHGLGRLSGPTCYNLVLPGNTEELLCPDLSYAPPERWQQAPMRGAYPVMAPDFVIEIASPSDTHPQMAAKAGVYLAAGVRLVWMVWPEQTSVEVWRPGLPAQSRAPGDTLDGADVLPGFACAVDAIFAA